MSFLLIVAMIHLFYTFTFNLFSEVLEEIHGPLTHGGILG